MHALGAEAPYFLEVRLGREVFQQLLARGVLVQLPSTPAGSLVILGPKGRVALGLSPNYRSPPAMAADQYQRRRCVHMLTSRGWSYDGKTQNLARLRDPSGRPAYMLARWRPTTVRSVRRILHRIKRTLITQDARLLVHTHRPHHFTTLIKQSAGLVQVLRMNGGRHERTWESH